MNFSLQIGSFRLGWGKPAKAGVPGKRNYSAGQVTRLTSDWGIATTSADVEARNDVTKLRSRSRELERDDPYARRYFKLLVNNVLGWRGIRLCMKVLDANGKIDSVANTEIEKGWKRWGKMKNCTCQRNLSWRDVCRLVLQSPARDGGVLVRIVEGFKNEFAFALQLIEIDHLDVYHNVPNYQGNEIRMGVELNEWKEPVAYWLWTRHPGDYNAATAFQRERIPASEILHLYLPDRVLQTIGVPWIVAAMLRLNMLNGYEEAELVAARVGACKGGYITKERPEEFTADPDDGEANKTEEMEPGVVRELDPGESFLEHDPKHPNAAYPAYTKQVLRGAASGMGVSYVSLANDLEGVNYSSIRAGVLEDREEWMMIQEWFIEHFCETLFERWLPFAILSGQVKLPMAKLEKFMAATFIARRWPWVDPLKDINASVVAIHNRLESRTSIVADMGGDFEETLDEIEEEERMAEDKGVSLPAAEPPLAQIEDEPPAGTGKPGTPAEEDPPAAKPKPKAKAKG